MMKKIFLVCTVALVLIFGCKKNNDSIITAAGFCDSSNVSYSADVRPLINTYCINGSNCHNVGSVNQGGELISYNQVYLKRSTIRSSVNLGTMPIGATMTEDEKKRVICWVDHGAANN